MKLCKFVNLIAHVGGVGYVCFGGGEAFRVVFHAKES